MLRRDEVLSVEIEHLERAYVLPQTRVTGLPSRFPGGKAFSFDGGVYREDGSLCEIATHLEGSPRKAHHPDPSMPSVEAVPLRGSFLFGGNLKLHFGHFLVEGLSRLWALDQIDHKPDGILFLSFTTNPKCLPSVRPDIAIRALRARPYIFDILQTLGIDLSIHIVSVPTQVERLIVPSQLQANGSGSFIAGHDVQQEFLRRRASRVPALRDGPKRIYVSRGAMSRVTTNYFIADQALTRNLKANGYTTVHPEKMSIAEQIALYRGADEIIFAEGSAIHLYALAAGPHQRVAIIFRRPRASPKYEDQLSGHVAAFVNVCAIVGQIVPTSLVEQQAAGNSLPCILDFDAVRDALAAAGFVDADKWESPADSELIADIAEMIALKRQWRPAFTYQLQAVRGGEALIAGYAEQVKAALPKRPHANASPFPVTGAAEWARRALTGRSVAEPESRSVRRPHGGGDGSRGWRGANAAFVEWLFRPTIRGK